MKTSNGFAKSSLLFVTSLLLGMACAWLAVGQAHAQSATPTLNLTITPTTVPFRDSVTLSWDNSNVELCGIWSTIEHWVSADLPDPLKGSMQYGPIINCTLIELVCLDKDGNEFVDTGVISFIQPGMENPVSCGPMAGRSGIVTSPANGQAVPAASATSVPATGTTAPGSSQPAWGNQGGGLQCNNTCQSVCTGNNACNAVCEQACDNAQRNENSCSVSCDNGQCTRQGNCGGNGTATTPTATLLPGASPLVGTIPAGGIANPASIGQCAMQCSANTCFQERTLAPGNIRQCVRQCVQGCLGEVSPANSQGFRAQSLPFTSAPTEQGAVNQCQNVLISPEDVPASLKSFASPFDTAGLGALTMGVWCDANGVEANIGNGQPTTFVHQTAYLAKNKEAWQQIALQGTPAAQSGWLVGGGRASLPVELSQIKGNHHYLIAYMCTWNKDKWQCGCSGDSCDPSKWSLQAFTAKN